MSLSVSKLLSVSESLSHPPMLSSESATSPKLGDGLDGSSARYLDAFIAEEGGNRTLGGVDNGLLAAGLAAAYTGSAGLEGKAMVDHKYCAFRDDSNVCNLMYFGVVVVEKYRVKVNTYRLYNHSATSHNARPNYLRRAG